MPAKQRDWFRQSRLGKFCRVDHIESGPQWRDELGNTDQLAAQIAATDGVTNAVIGRFSRPDEYGRECFVAYNGRRRVAVCKEQGREWVPVAMPDLSDSDLLLAGMQQDDTLQPNVGDQINQVRMLRNQGFSVKDIALKLRGESDKNLGGWVRDRVALIKLGRVGRDALREGLVTMGKARKIAKLSEPDQVSAIEKIRQEKAAGVKKAGSVKPKRPGLKHFTDIREEIATKGKAEYSRQDVLELLEWALDKERLNSMRSAMGLPECKPQATKDAA